MQAFDLEVAVNQQSWEWLFDVSRRLGVAIDLLDEADVPLIPGGARYEPGAIERLLTAADPTLDAAICDARGSATPASAAVEGFQIVCFGVLPEGVLILAQTPTDDESADESRRRLEAIGSWLTAAIEGSLLDPPHTACLEQFRIASFRRMLSQAVSYGSVRRVLGAFVEALGVWDNVRVRCYAAGANGGFLHFVSPVGTLPSSAPAELDDAARRWDGAIVRLSRAEADYLGLGSDPGDVVVLQLFAGADPQWLLVFSGSIDDAQQARLTFYSDMLRESLDEVHEATSRLLNSVTRQPPGPEEPLDRAADEALGRLSASIGGQQAALAVTTVTGIRALAVGNANLLPNLDEEARSNRLLVTSSDTASVMTVVIEREQPPFMAFERETIKSAVAVLHPWVQGALLPSIEHERRRRFRPLQNVFDQLAARAVGSGQDVSVIVVAVDPTVVNPDLLQMWLGRIRVDLRTGDFAGILSESEIAVLMCDTSAEQAAVVSARLKQLMASDDSGGVLLNPALATTTCSPDSPIEGSLVAAARAGATAIR
jgi:hypothetical protein